MARESYPAKKERLSKISAALERAYPAAHCELNYGNPLQLLVATILSAQCADKQVNLVTPELFKRYPNALAYAQADLAELQRHIQRLGFFRNKAKNIQSSCAALVERHGGKVPQTMEELTRLAGVGRKTANVVLGNAFGVEAGVVVDTHVARLSQRLGLTRHTAPEKIEQDLMDLVPKENWTLFSHWLIWHGRRRCFARNPDCVGCEVNRWCPSAFKVGKKNRRSKSVESGRVERSKGENRSNG